MELSRQTWTKKDGAEFKHYIEQFLGDDQTSARIKKLINTNMPFFVMSSPDANKLCKKIEKGNFQAFIALWMTDNYPLVSILGKLICKTKDFTTLKNYLLKYANFVDNWAHIDLLKFSIDQTHQQQFFELAQTLVQNPKPMARRMGIRILFKFIKDDNYIDQIFKILNGFEHETEYYVNMCNAWIIAECFAHQRDKTLVFLDHHHLNAFTINKAVSKCRDSFRVSAADKKLLLKYKQKLNTFTKLLSK